MCQADSHPSRRAFIGATGTVTAVGLSAGCQSHAARPDRDDAPAPTPPVSPTGRYQAGITLPQPAQRNLLAVVADLVDVDAAAVRPLLAELGEAIRTLTAGTDARLMGLEPGDLTVTVGVGPRLVREVDPALPGAKDLPRFSRERIAPGARGGDLLIQICADDALVVPVVAAALLERAGDRIRERWRQSGVRGANVPVDKGRAAPRNLFGFVDGIVGPHTKAEQRRHLWLAGPARVADGTLAVLRRMELDLPRFAKLSVAEQEAVFGRRRATGVPLSGGTIASGPDLGAKTPDGRYLVPVDAHARRAHSTAVGVGLMLRRSYSIDGPAPGLLFMSFQNDIRTFTNTLTRMDNSDALLEFTTTTASASFLILPGFDEQRPLGSRLFR
ncbi:Dyp-type peroxidase [Streptomyces rapamycinicus]|uniref:Peroxidase n=2 Tax=Streptomyces rapamycinicus TaxID=1226757 RepID=A0A0A0NGX2_STRRN|nr:Dyp-type peroxidase [Streptomyces rapamycinicus]AGP56441.1 peroxidase [Streptomyces rapamycinicus NRRL 5491]MBB4784040.1 dye decolorizing peroxidase [Streptomyces rapamycinicus]RLV80475.1 peroxidase [Streptomyces rapamycinicus NRRL 5491]UTO64384.1 Dyp-type peroxidase [Streptomyces rapamycinicus]UTP32339.1 Dyp-type peroxidase [Streptomyces rapamycinicus NRRL 5491]